MSRCPLLVVGVGNRHRGDDGVGPTVVDAIRAERALADVETMVADGDLSDLVVTWSVDHDVIIVDAMVGGRAPGSILVLDGLREPLPRGHRPLSSHGFGLVDTLELARLLGRLPRSLTIIAVEVGSTGVLDPLTETAADAVNDVVTRITALATQLGRAEYRSGLHQGVDGEEHNADPPVVA